MMRRAPPAWTAPAALFGAAGAASVGVFVLTTVLVLAISVFPGIYNVIPRRFGADVVVDTGEALLTFSRHGILAAPPLPLAPPVLHWNVGGTGVRVLRPAPADFAFSAGAADADLALVPGPLAGATCAYAANVTWDARGFAASCTEQAAPGTPGGAATLDAIGKVPFGQLPDVLSKGPPFFGYWDANLNVPALFNATCGPSDNFFYHVEVSGTTQLGVHTVWPSGDDAACYNGTWFRLPGSPIESVLGRAGIIVAVYGDYTADLIDVGGVPLAAVLNASFVVLGAAPGLPGAQTLAVEPGELTLGGATLGLPDVPAFPLATNVVPGYPKNPVVDRNGRWVSAPVGVPVETIAGTPNQVSAACIGHDCTLALPQDIATNSTPQFAGVYVGGDLLAPASPSAGNILFLPSNAGVAGQVYGRTASGAAWRDEQLLTLARYTTTTPAAVTGAAFKSVYGTGTGSRTIPGGTLVPDTKIEFRLACSYVNGAGSTTIRVVLGGTTLVTGAAFSGASAPLLIEGTAWVPAAGQMMVVGTTMRGTAVAELLVQPAPVAFAPAAALAFDVQASQGAASVSCYGTMEVRP